MAAPPLAAEIVLSHLVVDIGAGAKARQDIEIWNNSPSRAYVVAEPVEILDAGLPGERRQPELDPDKLGLLVSPVRMVLEPRQRRLLRIAALPPRSDKERTYRVTVKPVSAETEPEAAGLQIMVGYDVLVLVRPQQQRLQVSGSRSGAAQTIRNDGNVSVELLAGKQCEASRRQCTDLPSKRLYPGASWTQSLPGAGPVQYMVKHPGGAAQQTFTDEP